MVNTLAFGCVPTVKPAQGEALSLCCREAQLGHVWILELEFKENSQKAKKKGNVLAEGMVRTPVEGVVAT